MGSVVPPAGKEADARKGKGARSGAPWSDLDSLLDEALLETFPASDPIAVSDEPRIGQQP